MGYYDDMYEKSESRKRRDVGVGRLVMTSVTSAVIGGMVVLLMLPAISKSGYIPAIQSGNTALAMGNTIAPTTVSQPLSVNVDTATVRAVEKVENAVVGVVNIQRQDDIWSNKSSNVETGEGSGVIFEVKNGKAHIITNNHVIAGAQKVEVYLASGDKVDAKVLGADPLSDLAVLEVDGSKVTTVAELGDSSSLKVGEPAVAIGNPLGMKFSRTVTQGIVSSLDRSMPIDLDDDGQPEWELDVLQTDAAINPGNSGGALVNMYGQVIGINTMKISKAGVEGLGFAIPINDVKKISAQLMKDGTLVRAYIGITPRDLTNIPRYHWTETLHLPDNVNSGVVIMNTAQFSPAAKAGLREYDVVTKLDNTEIKSSAQLRKYLTLNKKPGDDVVVTYYRDGFKKTATAKLSQQQQGNN